MGYEDVHEVHVRVRLWVNPLFVVFNGAYQNQCVVLKQIIESRCKYREEASYKDQRAIGFAWNSTALVK